MPRFDRSPPESDIYAAPLEEQVFVRVDETYEVDPTLADELDATIHEILEGSEPWPGIVSGPIVIPLPEPLIRPQDIEDVETAQTNTEDKDDDSDRYTAKDIRRQALAVAALLGVVMYGSDVAKNIEAESRAEPGIKVVAEALHPENANRIIIVEDGFNTVNGDLLSDRLGPTFQQLADGEIWSVQSNNALMNTDALFEKALDLAVSRNIESISIATYSMGDMRGTSLAEMVVKETDIPVENIINVAGPSDYDSLQQHRKDEMAWARVISELVPGSANSSPFRWLSELYFYKDSYLKPESDPYQFITKNFNRFVNVIKGINIRFEKPFASNSFLLRQMDVIDTTNPAAKLESIGKYEQEHGLQTTNYIYLGSTEHDAMVNQDEAIEDFRKAAEAGGIPFYQYDVEGVSHGDFYLKDAVTAYEHSASIIAEDVIAQTKENRAEKDLRNYEIYNAENFASYLENK